MDILYIHPAKHAVGPKYVGLGTPYTFMPVGVVALANLLRSQGFAVAGVNYPAQLAKDPDYDLLRWLADYPEARVVLIDLHWYEHSHGALEVARVCKHILPQARTVVGGMTASIFADEIIAAFPYVDYVVRGDAEGPLVQLVRALCNGDEVAAAASPNIVYRRGEIIYSKAQSYVADAEMLDRLDFVDLSFLHDANWYRRLQFSATGLTSSDAAATGHWLCVGRGCYANCSFCGGGARAHEAIFRRKGVLTRSPARVASDIGRLADLGVRQVSFNLDPAMLGERYAAELFSLVRTGGTRLGLYNEQFWLPKPRFLRDLAATFDVSYSELAFTLLSGCEQVRRRNGKPFSNREFLSLLPFLREIGMPIYVYFSLNLPGEDEHAFEQTLTLAQILVDSYPPQLLKMINMLHTLDPLSPLARQPAKFGVEVHYGRFRDYYNYCRATPAARQGVIPVGLRGFEDNSGRSLSHMVERWNAFADRHGGMIYPVPPTW